MGRKGIYRCPSSGGDAHVLSKQADGANPQESFDGKTVYFVRKQSDNILMKLTLPVPSSAESEVAGLPSLRNIDDWVLSQGGIYFVPADAPRSLRSFDLNSKQVRSVFEEEWEFGHGLSISPDGRWIIYAQLRDVNSDIMMVDHFH